jgi:hypothetical protein
LAGLPSQSAKPATQVGTQRPAVHALAVVLGPVRHARPQAPQLFRSLAVVAQVPSQLTVPAGQHTDLRPAGRHVSPVLHAAGRPVTGSQQASPDPPQTAAQPKPPPSRFVQPKGLAHAAQPPQCSVVLIAVSQPLAGLPSQLPNPGAQTGAQKAGPTGRPVSGSTRRVQALEVVPAPAEQATPQPPQLLTLVFVSTQAPPQLVFPLAQQTELAWQASSAPPLAQVASEAGKPPNCPPTLDTPQWPLLRSGNSSAGSSTPQWCMSSCSAGGRELSVLWLTPKTPRSLRGEPTV